VNSPYGSEVSNQGTGDVAYKFTDKEKDNTGLDYFGARYYDPEVGRFISVDPGKQGTNWYEYCFDNPVKMVDLDGNYAMLFSHADQKMYWLNDDGSVNMSWTCKDAVMPGHTRISDGTYNNCYAEKPGVSYELHTTDSKGNPITYYEGTFRIQTGSPDDKIIHGGGTSSEVPDPNAPYQVKLIPTYGCLRMYNADGEDLSNLMRSNGNDFTFTVQTGTYVVPTTYDSNLYLDQSLGIKEAFINNPDSNFSSSGSSDYTDINHDSTGSQEGF
jgi:RHS repeat-associated protein